MTVLLLSKNFYAGGTFNSLDQVPPMSSSTGPAAPVHGVGAEPWEPVPIFITGVDIVLFQGASFLTYGFAGNSFSPDIMRWYGTANPVVSGTGFPFPAASADPPHIDLHVSGTNGQPFQCFYTVYYTKN